MQSFKGKSVYKGIVMGPVVVLKKNDYQVKGDPGSRMQMLRPAVFREAR